ncbi:type I 3-dehydroquinate dehydratase [Acidianus sulfidivorans JP7]|uniref:3-dehydroquinate dehydratase n=1 Tax=Acidianus sulfidivorans JP7 TaxID=619593 RepID=A0A2U9INR4_9CREN|nr:type I 3-dehydroquinate dehydratase [Acidianus sulfidivorans]AWR97641.1 type I 3-dehydroquinate dehydratase [Acidianus sulfidivorans JP7]
MRPLIVASLPFYSEKDLQRIKNIDADLIELRLDYSLTLPDINSLLPFKDKIIVTIRDVNEGGVNKLDDDVKKTYLNKLDEEGFLYDVEASFLEKYSVNYENKIVSMHYFNYVPDFQKIEYIINKYEEKAYTVKIAVIGKNGYKQLLSNLLFSHNKLTVLPMNTDPLERIAFGIFGSKLIYTYVDNPTAPGQMHYSKAMKIIRLLFDN